MGDFTRLQTTRLRNNYNLKQIVNLPTRGERTLDVVLTKLQDHYETPTQRPPLGLSDHMSIEVQPKVRIKSNSSTTTVQSRDMRPSKRLAMRNAGSRDGAVVRALASHQCGAGSIPRLGVICGLSLLVLFSAPRGFSPGTPVFPSPQKPTFDLICIDLI